MNLLSLMLMISRLSPSGVSVFPPLPPVIQTIDQDDVTIDNITVTLDET